MTEQENKYMDSIVQRITSILPSNYNSETRSGIWDWCLSYNTQVSVNRDTLEDMSNNNLTWGIFGGDREDLNRLSLINLAKALGIYGILNTESDVLKPRKLPDDISNDEILQQVENKIGFKINFPEFIGNRIITKTNYGILTDRHCHYLWMAKRIMELCPDKNSAILEIGAGIGILGYYLDKVGYKDYTTIDLAYANACQTYFLARNLPERNIILSKDKENPFDIEHKDSIKLLHSTDFKNVPKNRFNIIINIDSLTEMNPEDATTYMQSNCAPLFLSVNHEVNNYRVIDHHEPNRKLVYRYPFWIREGYVEELYKTI